jgi:hypothetical protein
MDDVAYQNMVSFKFPSEGPVINISGLSGASVEQARRFLAVVSELVEGVANRE